MSKFSTIEQRLVDNIENTLKLADPSEEELRALIHDIAMLGISQREAAIKYLAQAKAILEQRLKNLKTAKAPKPKGPTWN